MKNQITYFSVFFMFLFPVLHAEPVTLTDKEGRSIQAEIITVVSGVASVRLTNGREYRIPIEKFSDDSVKKLENWKLLQAVKGGEPFRIIVRTYRENEEKGTTIATKTRNYDAGYKVTIQNKTPMHLPELTVEYLLVKESNMYLSSGDEKINYGTAKLEPLGLRQEASFLTLTVPIKEEGTRKNWDRIGGPERVEDELGGIWIKIKSGDLVVYEFAKPSVLPEKIKWNKP